MRDLQNFNFAQLPYLVNNRTSKLNTNMKPFKSFRLYDTPSRQKTANASPSQIKRMQWVTLLLTFLMMAQLSFADTRSLINWVDPTPSALQPFDGDVEALADLVGSSLLFYPQTKKTITLPYQNGPKTYQNVQYVTGAMIVPASSEEVEKLLTNYAGYSQLFPKMTSSVIQKNEQDNDVEENNKDSGRTIVKYKMRVDVPIPLLSFNENFIIQHEKTRNSISSLILESPVQYGSGKFEWFALKNGKTLVTLTHWGDLDRPKGFLVSTIFRAMPEIKMAIPHAVEGFVLESLRQHFYPNFSSKPLPIKNIVPVMNLRAEQKTKVIQLLRQGGVVQFNHQPVWLAKKDGTEKLWFVSSFYNMPAQVAKTKDALANPSNFPEIYRQVRQVTTTPLADSGSKNNIKIGLGLGVISIPVYIELAYQPEPDPNAIRFYTTGGDVELIHGRFQFEAIDSKNTLVGLTVGTHLGDHPPLLLRLAKNLPFSDYLPTVGSAHVILDKARLWLSK
jgi:hypothetical protein